MDNTSRKKILTLVGAVVGFVIVIILVSILIMVLNPKKYQVIVDNLKKCSSNISDYAKDNLFDNAYNLVKTQNDIEGRKSDDIYHAIFRDGTCETETYNGVDDIISYTTSAIIDIKEAGYSFNIKYNWVNNDIKQSLDLGPLETTCLSSDKLLYGEFNCKDNPMVSTKIEIDPILSILPYFGDGFIIKPRLDTKTDGTEYYTIIIEYDPPESVYLNGEVGKFKSTKKQVAVDYLTEQGINLKNYTLEETFKITGF